MTPNRRQRVPAISLAQAKFAISVAARASPATDMSIAIVDEDGDLIMVERQDKASSASTYLAMGVARAAALTGEPSGKSLSLDDRPTMRLQRADCDTALRGGVPVLLQGRTIGAVGVSGSDIDVAMWLANTAAASIESALRGDH
ncbi:GlcG/HbpS family heme-binding protein [Stenotrophomonas maltophilia]|uniref:GlcG/HbpS family heme-binding protein n=1 Tax=Stenotrophomonas maltophilia TaxID=40324 RepID=UPI003D7E6373